MFYQSDEGHLFTVKEVLETKKTLILTLVGMRDTVTLTRKKARGHIFRNRPFGWTRFDRERRPV